MNDIELGKMEAHKLLEWMGDDASRWAQAFCAIKRTQGWGSKDIDEGLMTGWFANAIEHSSFVRGPGAFAKKTS